MPMVANKETGETWAEICAKYFDEIIISIDGTAEANFRMRPVINLQKVVNDAAKAGNQHLASKIAHKQFEETVAGYEALTQVVGTKKNIALKINTVVAKDNVDNIGEFGRFLSEKTSDKSFRVDQWDITQVFASPETSEAEQKKYLVTEKDFFASVVEASITSPNIPKRAKANTSDRCLIMDQNGRTYIGGKNNLELGLLNSDNISDIAMAIHKYNKDKKLFLQRKKQYLSYKPV